MKQRRIVLGMLLAGVLAACGGPPTPEDRQSDSAETADFSGAYRPMSGGGDIAVIVFKTGEGYMLMPTGCSTQSCAEVGTYTLDPERTLLTLKDSQTGKERVVDIRVLETSGGSGSGASTGGSLLRTQDLVSTGTQVEQPGTTQVSGSGNQQLNKNNGQKTTDKDGAQLLNAIASAAMNGVQMAQQQAGQNGTGNTDPNTNTNPGDPALQQKCSQPPPAGILPTGTPAQPDLDSYFQQCPSGPQTGAPGATT